jgi:hypothetical protein
VIEQKKKKKKKKKKKMFIKKKCSSSFVVLFVATLHSSLLLLKTNAYDDSNNNNNNNNKNQFWSIGASGIDQKRLPEIASWETFKCPEKRYILLGPRTYTGGFNNMFMTFQGALLLARYTNRTFVVPAARNDRYQDFRFSQAIDYDAMRKVWPCFHDSNKEWGVEKIPEEYRNSNSNRRRRKLMMKTSAVEEGDDYEDDYLVASIDDDATIKHHHRNNNNNNNNNSSDLINDGDYGFVKVKRRMLKATTKTKDGKKLKTSDMFDDYKPKPGTIATMAPVKVRGPSNTGRQISEIARDFIDNEEASRHPLIMISGSAWGGLMTACMKPYEDGLFFKHVKPAEHIAREVEAFKKLKGLVDGEYVGVHLRYLEGKCPGRAEAYYMPKVQKQIAAMCHNTFPHTKRVLEDHGLREISKIYLASDRQRPDADKTFEKAGSISYDKGNKKDKYFGDGTQFVKGYIGQKVFEPAVDMFILAGAKIFVGNMLSTFSTNTANIRYGWGARRSVLAWPEPAIMKERSFWECERAAFWCGTETKTWSSAGHTKAKGNC